MQKGDLVAGVDGCRGGWLAVTLDPAGTCQGLEIQGQWKDLALGSCRYVGVDMPIGLSDRGARACDQEARRHLPKGRKSSVFAPPRRYMLQAADWQEANQTGRAREGKGISRQSWNIAGKIRELDDALSPEDQRRIREVHPELVFHHLAQGTALPSKHQEPGHVQRLALLESHDIHSLREALQQLPRGAAGADDLLDAAACAFAARRMHQGTAVCLPSAPPTDARGLRMEIWY